MFWKELNIGLAAASYGAYVAAAWVHYGKVKPASGHAADALLDGFMPQYEIARDGPEARESSTSGKQCQTFEEVGPDSFPLKAVLDRHGNLGRFVIARNV